MPQSKPKKKKNKDENAPKRASTAFMLWLNEHRDEIKRENPSLKVTEIAKKGGEMWRELKDKSIWEEKAAKDKERYTNEMKNYKASGDDSVSKKRKKESSSPKKSTSQTMAGSGFKSKEYISEDDSSSGSDDNKKKKKKVSKNVMRSFLRIYFEYVFFRLLQKNETESEEEDDDDDDDEEGSGSASD